MKRDREMTAGRQVEIALEVRVAFDGEHGDLTEILTALRKFGGELSGHLVDRFAGRCLLRCLCEHPAAAALALKELGFEVATETVVAVRVDNRPGAFSHLVRSLEAADIAIEYTYATAAGERMLAIVRTTNNPRAEDVLKQYLDLVDPPA